MAMRALLATAGPGLLALVEREQPDLIVSTYPGITAPLGMLRERGELATPVCGVITDLTSLHFWAHPGVDLHLATYAQSLPEIAAIADGAPARLVRPPLHRTHWESHDRHGRRAALGIGPWQRLAVVSGGGWGVGDLRGAVNAALRVDGLQVAVICGYNARTTRRLTREYRDEPRVRVLGFVTAMAEVLNAADVLVHSTGGMTCLEAAAHGCPSLAYGFSHGHVRYNVEAMVRHGLLAHAADAADLTTLLEETIAGGRRPAGGGSDRVAAGAAVLESLGIGVRTAPSAEPTPVAARS